MQKLNRIAAFLLCLGLQFQLSGVHAQAARPTSTPMGTSTSASSVGANDANRFQVGGGSGLVKPQMAIEATIEAVRDATLSSQVPGSVLGIHVKAGDKVKAGTVLIELDAGAAVQQVQGAQAQVLAAQTQEVLAAQELERQRALYAQQYVSKAALDRAQAQWDAARAQVNALKANTQVAQAQRGYFTIRAPFDGVVSQVPANPGDMAMPGKPLVVMHDPSWLRIKGDLPQTLKAEAERASQPFAFEVPGVLQGFQQAQKMELIPSVDAQTHTMELRLTLARTAQGASSGLAPGMHARIWVPLPTAQGETRNWIPSSAVIRRGEITGVYVIVAEGAPRLRQIRLGRESGGQVEVLSGLKAGETIVSRPQSTSGATQ